MAQALPQYGQAPSQKKKLVTHAELAGMNGVRRETITRRFGKISRSKRRRGWKLCDRGKSNATTKASRLAHDQKNGADHRRVDSVKVLALLSPGGQTGDRTGTPENAGVAENGRPAGSVSVLKPAVRSFEPLAEILAISNHVNAANTYEAPVLRGGTGDKSTKTAEQLAAAYGEAVFDKTAYVNGFAIDRKSVV